MRIVKVNPNLPTPKPATPDSAGMDLYADITETVVLQTGESKLISTGIKVEIPKGFVGFLLPRSGKGSKGMKLKNTVGTIDSDYRGIVYANTFNYETEPLTIAPGERFAQMVVVSHLDLNDLEVVDSLDETARGEGGFGSTGKH